MRKAALLLVVLAASGCVRGSRELAEPKPPAAPKQATPPPVEIPRREGAAVLVLPTAMDRAPLFPSELRRLERWVARHLALQEQVALDPVPPEEVEELRRRVEQGRSPDGEQQCLAPVPVRAALEHAWPKAHRAHLVADCSKKPCRLTVAVQRPDGAALTAWSAEVANGGSFEEWEAAAQRLAPAERPGRAPKPMPKGDALAVTHVSSFGAWGDEAPPKLAPEPAALGRCHLQGHAPSGPTQVFLEYDAQGRARRCSAEGWRDPPLVEQEECFCRTLSGLSVPPGEEGRRLAVEVVDYPDLEWRQPDGERIVARLERFTSTDLAIGPQWLHAALPWVGLCYGATLLRDQAAFPARFTVDATGRVVKAQIDGLQGSKLLEACVTGYLQHVALPCPLSGRAELEFTVGVRRTP